MALECYYTQPAKQFPSPSAIVFTDASERGDSITGAVYQASSGLSQSFKLQGHTASLNSVTHRELAGIHRALTLLSEPQHQGTHLLMTNSLASIWLIDAPLSDPFVSSPEIDFPMKLTVF